MDIDVFFRGKLLGTLCHSADEGYVFTYSATVLPSHHLAIHMPATQREWRGQTLFPIFQVSYPEGFLEKLLERRVKRSSAEASPPQLLLETGKSRVGGLTLLARHQTLPDNQAISSAGATPNNTLSLSSMLETLPSGAWPGVSGGFPKYLQSRAPGLLADGVSPWIAKLNDEDHPELTILEYFGMEVSRRMGLPTAEVHLSDDTEILYVKRFDLAADLRPLQFEDMCSLLGLSSRDKYASSFERVVKAIKQLPHPDGNRRDCALLYAQYLLAATIRNGDAHLKNFGLLYAPDVAPRLSPVYDMLSMGVYAPRANNGDALDGMALTLRGSRRWPRQADLDALANLCRVSDEEQGTWCVNLDQAVKCVSAEVVQFCQDHPRHAARNKLVRMLELWAIGCSVVAPEAGAVARSNSKLAHNLP